METGTMETGSFKWLLGQGYIKSDVCDACSQPILTSSGTAMIQQQEEVNKKRRIKVSCFSDFCRCS
jgi:hypothetical protein